MKKLLFVVMAVFAMSFISGGEHKTQASNSTDSVVVSDSTVDSVSIDSIVK